MNKSKILKWMIIGFSLISIHIGLLIYNQQHHKWVKSHPQMYAYDAWAPEASSCLIILDKKHMSNYLDYYQTREKDPKTDMYINFPLKGLASSERVYIIGYEKDSLLAEVVSYYDYGPRLGGSYTRGWVYAKNLHEKGPLEYGSKKRKKIDHMHRNHSPK